jgi:hypothetical protein
MSDSIRLHKEHGLNPTLCQCIICGEDTGEIALLGSSYKEKAPMHMVVNYEPCKTCRDGYLARGVMLVEMKEQKVYGKEHKVPTGKIVVITEKAFKRIFNAPVPERRIAMVEEGLIEKLQGEQDPE